ncbi:MAG: hypothetical protein HQL08_01530 [Nitrospirae bacterium]|nr:hypothetical protein [Nitrospirota bacterium]
MGHKCYFCDNPDIKDVKTGYRGIPDYYNCPRCGIVNLHMDTADDMLSERFREKDKQIISIWIRNEYEKSNRKKPSKRLTLEDLDKIIKQYSPLNPLEKMDNALLIIEKASGYVGQQINISYGLDYPYYHCFGGGELHSILSLLSQEGLIKVPDQANPHNHLSISAKGYQKLSEIKKPGKDSRQCFVAMWFTTEMSEAYDKAIRPAIEFIEEGGTSPRFEAVKIDNVEHVNDINDEIIAQIRRSRFMICDLTGYRGGVYFEAGFAYGLGLDVIYTCREDWTKEEILKDNDGNEIKTLRDKNNNEIQIKKEGVHFDLAHRNRIEWSPDDLEDFRIKLQNRIRAVIF